MKSLLVISVGAVWLLQIGCAYRGAVYAEYTQFALDIRATQESTAPIKVNLGYDRGVSLYAPKLNTARGVRGESVSVISWNNIGSVASPSLVGSGSNSILQVDAGFISGVAANIASAPKDAMVVVMSPTGSTNYVADVRGAAGERIQTALFASATLGERAGPIQVRVRALTDKLATLTDAQVKKILEDLHEQTLPGLDVKNSAKIKVSRIVSEAELIRWENAFKQFE